MRNTTVGMSSTTTTASNSQSGPIDNSGGSAKLSPPTASNASTAGQRGSGFWCEVFIASIVSAAGVVDWAGLAVAGGRRGAAHSNGGVAHAGQSCDEYGAGTHADGGGYAGYVVV